MSIEGSISITINRSPTDTNAVSIRSSRPVHASQVMRGKTLEEASQWLPLLFSVCATAQACANVRAWESALGLTPNPHSEAARDALVNAETLREHLWRIHMDWPKFLNQPADTAAMAQIGNWYQRATGKLRETTANLFLPACDANPPSATAQTLQTELEDVLQTHLFHMPPRTFLSILDPEELMRWSSRTNSIPARLIHRLVQQGWSSAGRCDIAALPELEEATLHQRLENKEFVATPNWNDNPCESSVLTRQQHPLLASLSAIHGNGLLTRVTARLIEIARLPASFTQGASETDLAHSAERIRLSSNPAIGTVEAARGRLIHRLGLHGDRIVLYQILAPTEWNFHPEGVVARSLATLQGDRDEIRQQADLLINTIDPCVQYDLEVI